MKPRHYDTDQIVFEENSVATEIYFIIDGCLSLNINLYDSDLLRRLNCRRTKGNNTIYRMKSQKSTIDRDFSKRTSIKKLLNPNKQTQLQLCKLAGGSIISSNQAILGCKRNIYAYTTTATNMFTLDSSVLGLIAKENIRLRIPMNIRKTKYIQDNRYTGQAVEISPILDCYKHFEFESFGEKASWKSTKKFKNAVLMQIVLSRKKFSNKVTSLKSLTARLKAVVKAESKGWNELARMIERRETPYKTVNFAHLIKAEELKVPILYQFASLATEMGEANDRLQQETYEVLKRTKTLQKRRKEVNRKAREIEAIFKLIYNSFVK